MPELGRAEEKALLSRVVLGDPGAERELTGRLVRVVRSAARRLVFIPAADREDNIQDALLYLLAGNWARLQRWQGEGSLMSWAWTVARNHMVSRWRADPARREDGLGVEVEDIVDDGAIANPTIALEVEEARKCVEQALRDLNEDQRNFIELRHMAGLKHSAIAVRLGRTLGYVGPMMARAERRLAQLIKDRCWDHLPTLIATASWLEAR